MRIKPRCRFCGTGVKAFGDVCTVCDTGRDPAAEVAYNLARADAERIAERGDDG